MRIFLICFLLLSVFTGFSQEKTEAENSQKIKIDSLYREDQFYFGLTFNVLQKKPSGLNQSDLSTGLLAGFIRDMPLNKNRTIAIASGLGFTFNNYNQNISITRPNEIPIYAIINSEFFFKKNKFEQLIIDVPIEFRWRTSSFESHKFWRIYSGFKLSYLVYDKSIFIQNQEKIVLSNNKDFNKFLYGAYISAGYNTMNVYAYYGLNPLFKSAKIDNETINMNAMNIGVIFYIL